MGKCQIGGLRKESLRRWHAESPKTSKTQTHFASKFLLVFSCVTMGSIIKLGKLLWLQCPSSPYRNQVCKNPSQNWCFKSFLSFASILRMLPELLVQFAHRADPTTAHKLKCLSKFTSTRITPHDFYLSESNRRVLNTPHDLCLIWAAKNNHSEVVSYLLHNPLKTPV